VLLDPFATGTRAYLVTYCAIDRTQPLTRAARFYRTAWSSDGARWRRGRRIAVRPPACVDRHALVRDPATGDFLFFCRGEQPFRERVDTVDRAERTVCLQRSRDLKHWSPTRVVMAPEPADPPGANIYSLMPFFRGETLVWVCQVHDQRCHVETVTTHLCWSHDAVTWQRRREEFIPLGPPGQWDRFNNAVSDAPLVVGETMQFHYSGRCHRHAGYQPSGRPDSGTPYGGIGIATLRLDRFAAVAAGFDGGSFTARPMAWPVGKALYLNADCRWGEIEVELHGVGAGAVSARTIVKGRDGVKLPVDLRMPRDGQPVTLTFRLRNASVYALYCE
jgi:hypothetical protein